MEQIIKLNFVSVEGDECCYSGYVSSGIRNGWGYIKWFKGPMKGASYNGQFKEGKFSGLGILSLPNGNRVEGQFKSNKINGFAIESGDKKYEGNWEKNMKSG